MRLPIPAALRLVWMCVLAMHASPVVADDRSQPALRVLFIGNSYLYTNNLPAMVQSLAAGQGVVVETTLLAEPDYALSDHLRRQRLGTLLEQPWDWVILQQGPSALPESRRDLVDSVRRIAARLEGKPTRIALMSAWPAQRHAAMSLQAEASYREAALAIGACVLPVAGAWRVAHAQSDAPVLYAADRLHATPRGTLLAALTVMRGLLAMDPSTAAPAPADVDEAGLAKFRQLDTMARAAETGEVASCLASRTH